MVTTKHAHHVQHVAPAGQAAETRDAPCLLCPRPQVVYCTSKNCYEDGFRPEFQIPCRFLLPVLLLWLVPLLVVLWMLPLPLL